MSTFQVILYAIVRGFSEFLPISAAVHMSLVSEALGWPLPADRLQGHLSLGVFLAVLLYFRHEWASMISSFLGVVLLRRKPMTPDERMPLFLLTASLPLAGLWYYTQSSNHEALLQPVTLAASTALFALPILAAEFLGRKNKGPFDWNWFDSIAVGMVQLLALIPGCGRMTGALVGGMLRGYNREAIAKFAFFCSAPFLAGSALIHLHGLGIHAASTNEASWMTATVAVVVSCLSGLLAIGGLMRQIQRKTLGPYAGYRFFIAAVFAAVIWFRSRGIA